eukprot:CAMPEP_0119030486 /NCGR_PEP_ID=MMETSP1176-20130426/41055_1 /TAXON_ID=265551 /ORGANISM="Synedropsis recta cf, Strain CCMP1620" /LENGTH=99 /DNA_ID=CAMNT_0006986857 /DNA_START=733 /DNA_END=1033 /DNA_ORIENTATION=+
MDDEPTKEEGTLATATTEDDKTTPLITSFVPDGILQDYADRYLKEHHSKRWNENASTGAKESECIAQIQCRGMEDLSSWIDAYLSDLRDSPDATMPNNL